MGESHSNAWPILHTLLAQGFLACVVALACVLREPGPPAEVGGWVRRRALALAIMIWIQAGLGALLRHETQEKNQWGLVLHLGGAMLVIIFAVRLVAPAVVDVSSGVERSPGIKDHALMRAFAEAARSREGR